MVGFEGKEIGLGVVNPRTDQVETPEQIRAAVEEALRLYPAERVFLNPDCGFGTFSNRPMNTLEESRPPRLRRWPPRPATCAAVREAGLDAMDSNRSRMLGSRASTCFRAF